MPPSLVLRHGLKLVNLDPDVRVSSCEQNEKMFEQHFGACAFALSTQWCNLVHDKTPTKKLTNKKVNERLQPISDCTLLVVHQT